ncbi:MAG: FAD:protein FMN transferase [Planctomycetota bacterium]|nr:FAD:protein FMN transferase [Planctomycetota bacterium]
MGTTFRIVVEEELNGLSPTSLEPLRNRINARLDDIENMMSTWRTDSELSRFNVSESTDWFAVSKDVTVVVAEAQRIWKMSDGAFDPTVAPLIRLWHFAEEPGDQTLPLDEAIQAAKANTGFDQIEVRANPPALRKRIPQLELNLSAIAKGFAVDAISELLVKHGYQNHLVEIGGEMRSSGAKHENSRPTPWVAGIERPDAWPQVLFATLPLKNQAIATSGDYRNFFEVDGQRYSHTIDPDTGRPVTHDLASVTVLAPRCMTADALATAIEVMGPDRGLEFARENDLPVLMITRATQGLTNKTSENFPRLTYVEIPSRTIRHSDDEETSMRDSVLATVLAAIGIFALAIAGMAVGVIFSNRSIKGSCGGLANMPGHDGKSICEVCTVPAEECRDAALRKIRQQAEHAENGFEVQS